MKTQRLLLSIVLVAVLLLSACNLAAGTAADGSTPDPLADQQTQVAFAVLQTQAAAGSGSSLTPSLTPTLTFTTTPDVPMVTVSMETNCRTGPGEPYEILGALPVGVPAEVVGKNAYGDTWIIKLPSNPAITCWLWGYHATVVGDTSGLTVYTPPPTPTPSGNFIFAYAGFGVGPGYECFTFSVTNTGGVTWESFSLSVENKTDGGLWTSWADAFTSYDAWCFNTGSQLNLEAGEFGTASVTTFLPSSPSGDLFEAILMLCSSNSLSGYCITKMINFYP